jgi:hypothetical protein
MNRKGNKRVRAIGRGPGRGAILVGLLAVVGLVRPSWANPEGPSLEPVNQPTSFRNDTSSEVLPDLYDPMRFYVFPPAAGTAEAMEVQFGPNNVHCDLLFELQESSRELTRQLSDLALEAERFEERLAELVAVRRVVLSLYEHYARLEGGGALVVYRAPWEANVRRLSWLNPGLSFEPIATSEVRIRGSFLPGMGRDRYLSLFPLFLRVFINGVASEPGHEGHALAAFPTNVYLEAVFSLVASCALVSPERVDLHRRSDGLPPFSLSATYTYPVISGYRGVLSYDLWRLLDFLMASGEWSSEDFLPALSGRVPAAALRLRWLDPDVPLATRQAARREHFGLVLDEALQWAAAPGGTRTARPWPLAYGPTADENEPGGRRAALADLARRWPPPWWSALRHQDVAQSREVYHVVRHEGASVTVYANHD